MKFDYFPQGRRTPWGLLTPKNTKGARNPGGSVWGSEQGQSSEVVRPQKAARHRFQDVQDLFVEV